MTTRRWPWLRLAAPGAAGHLAAALAGALLPLALAPLNWWPLAIVSAALLAWLIGSLPPASAAVRAFCYGYGQFAVGASWIYVSVNYHGLHSPLLAGAITAMFCALCALCSYALPWWLWRRLPLASGTHGLLWAFPALWVLGEWSRCWLFTGFPWLLVGYGHLHTPLAGWAPVGGVLFIGFAVAQSAAALLILLRGGGRATALAVLAVLWGGGALLNTVEWTQPSTQAPLRAALVQANIPIDYKWEHAQRRKSIARYRALSAPLWSEHQLVVWPETAQPNWYRDSLALLRESSATAAASGSTLLSGIGERHGERVEDFRFYNAIWALGAGSGRYHKRHLVPYGEYWPLANWAHSLFPFMDLRIVGFQPGAAKQPLLQAAGHAIAPYICYEIIFPELVREAPGRGAAFLLTVSEDAWFGRSLMPHQHLQIAQMRALETGRALLRGTNSGISALIDHRGRLVARGGLFQSEVVSGQLSAREGLTPFARFGSLPTLLLCAALLAVGTAGGAAAARRRAASA